MRDIPPLDMRGIPGPLIKIQFSKTFFYFFLERNHERETNKAKWTVEQLQKALDTTRSGDKIRKYQENLESTRLL